MDKTLNQTASELQSVCFVNGALFVAVDVTLFYKTKVAQSCEKKEKKKAITKLLTSPFQSLYTDFKAL